MIRLFFFFYISIICSNISAQNPLSNRIILKMIFGNCNRDGASYTQQKNEKESPNNDSLIYKITYKKNITLENKKILFVISEAPNSYQDGHTIGFRNFYFFRKRENSWVLVNSIVANNEIPLGDVSEYNIVDIGKYNKALITTFQSTGNQHFEKTISLYYLTQQKISFLLNIDLEYSNEAWNIPETENMECNSVSYQSTYKIIKSTKNWFDVKVHKLNYGFTKGCKVSFIESQEDYAYIHDGKEYIEIKK